MPAARYKRRKASSKDSKLSPGGGVAGHRGSRTLVPTRQSRLKSPLVKVNIGCHEFKVGDRVTISGVKFGILRYYGHVQFAEGKWCGIELRDADGKHDGTVDGTRYFTCPQGHGIFAPVAKVSSVTHSEKVKNSAQNNNLSTAANYNTDDTSYTSQLPAKTKHGIDPSCKSKLRSIPKPVSHTRSNSPTTDDVLLKSNDKSEDFSQTDRDEGIALEKVKPGLKRKSLVPFKSKISGLAKPSICSTAENISRSPAKKACGKSNITLNTTFDKNSTFHTTRANTTFNKDTTFDANATFDVNSTFTTENPTFDVGNATFDVTDCPANLTRDLSAGQTRMNTTYVQDESTGIFNNTFDISTRSRSNLNSTSKKVRLNSTYQKTPQKKSCSKIKHSDVTLPHNDAANNEPIFDYIMAQKSASEVSKMMTTSQISHASSLGILSDYQLDDNNLLLTTAEEEDFPHATEDLLHIEEPQRPPSNRISIDQNESSETLDKAGGNTLSRGVVKVKRVPEKMGLLVMDAAGVGFDEEGEIDREIAGIATPEIDMSSSTSKDDGSSSPDIDMESNNDPNLTFDVDQGHASTPLTPAKMEMNINEAIRPKLHAALGRPQSPLVHIETDRNANKASQRPEEEYPKRMRTSDEFKDLKNDALSASFELARTAVTQYANLVQGAELERARSQCRLNNRLCQLESRSSSFDLGDLKDGADKNAVSKRHSFHGGYGSLGRLHQQQRAQSSSLTGDLCAHNMNASYDSEALERALSNKGLLHSEQQRSMLPPQQKNQCQGSGSDIDLKEPHSPDSKLVSCNKAQAQDKFNAHSHDNDLQTQSDTADYQVGVSRGGDTLHTQDTLTTSPLSHSITSNDVGHKPARHSSENNESNVHDQSLREGPIINTIGSDQQIVENTSSTPDLVFDAAQFNTNDSIVLEGQVLADHEELTSQDTIELNQNKNSVELTTSIDNLMSTSCQIESDFHDTFTTNKDRKRNEHNSTLLQTDNIERPVSGLSVSSTDGGLGFEPVYENISQYGLRVEMDPKSMMSSTASADTGIELESGECHVTNTKRHEYLPDQVEETLPGLISGTSEVKDKDNLEELHDKEQDEFDGDMDNTETECGQNWPAELTEVNSQLKDKTGTDMDTAHEANGTITEKLTDRDTLDVSSSSPGTIEPGQDEFGPDRQGTEPNETMNEHEVKGEGQVSPLEECCKIVDEKESIQLAEQITAGCEQRNDVMDIADNATDVSTMNEEEKINVNEDEDSARDENLNKSVTLTDIVPGEMTSLDQDQNYVIDPGKDMTSQLTSDHVGIKDNIGIAYKVTESFNVDVDTDNSKPPITEDNDKEIDSTKMVSDDTIAADSMTQVEIQNGESASFIPLSSHITADFIQVSATPPPDVDQDAFNQDEAEGGENEPGVVPNGDVEMLDTSVNDVNAIRLEFDVLVVESDAVENGVVTSEESDHVDMTSPEPDVRMMTSSPIVVGDNGDLHTPPQMEVEMQPVSSECEDDKNHEKDESKSDIESGSVVNEEPELDASITPDIEDAQQDEKATQDKKFVKDSPTKKGSSLAKTNEKSSKLKRPSLLARSSSAKSSSSPSKPQTRLNTSSSQLKKPANPVTTTSRPTPKAKSSGYGTDSAKITKRKTDTSSTPVPSKKAAGYIATSSTGLRKTASTAKSYLNASSSDATKAPSKSATKSRLAAPSSKKLMNGEVTGIVTHSATVAKSRTVSSPIGATSGKKEGTEPPSSKTGAKATGLRKPSALLRPKTSTAGARSKLVTSTPKRSHGPIRNVPGPDVSVLNASHDSTTSNTSKNGVGLQKPGHRTTASLKERDRNNSISSELSRSTLSSRNKHVSVTSTTSTTSHVSALSQGSMATTTAAGRKRKSLATSGASSTASTDVTSAKQGTAATPRRTSMLQRKPSDVSEPKKPGLSAGRGATKSKLGGSAASPSPRTPTYQNKNKPSTTSPRTSSTATTKVTTTPSATAAAKRPSAAAARVEQHAEEISRLEALCESRTKELNYARMQLKQSAAGFEAMSVLLNYTANGLDALACAEVKRQLEETRLRLDNTHVQLAELMTQRDALIEEIKCLKEKQASELEQVRHDHVTALQSTEERLNKQHEIDTSKLKDEHCQEISTLKSSHETSMRDMAAAHESLVKQKEQEHEKAILLEKQTSKAYVADLQQQHEYALSDITKRFDNIKMTLSEKVEHLRAESEAMRRREREYLASYKADSDSKVAVAIQPFKHLPQEIESLKAVMEMRNQEIHELRRKNGELEKQLEELPKARDKIIQLQQRQENMEAVLKIKADNERQLSERHSVLLRQYDKEYKANKRLSMDKDQLEWRLSQDSASMEAMLNRSISHSPTSSAASTPEPMRRKKSPMPAQSPRSPRGGIAMEFFEPKSPRLTSPRTNGNVALRKKVKSADFDRPLPVFSNRHSSADLYAPRETNCVFEIAEYESGNGLPEGAHNDSVMSSSTVSEPSPKAETAYGGKTNLKRSGTYDLLNEEFEEGSNPGSPHGELKQSDV